MILFEAILYEMFTDIGAMRFAGQALELSML